MAHFAQVDDDGIVLRVNAVSNCAIGGCIGSDNPFFAMNPDQHGDCGTLDFPDTEPRGQAMLAESGFTGTWLQCSYSGSFRSAFPGVGWKYDHQQDAFVCLNVPDNASIQGGTAVTTITGTSTGGSTTQAIGSATKS